MRAYMKSAMPYLGVQTPALREACRLVFSAHPPAADFIPAGRDNEQVAGIVLQAIMFNSFSTTITGSTTDDVPDRGDLFWGLLLHGLAGDR